MKPSLDARVGWRMAWAMGLVLTIGLPIGLLAGRTVGAGDEGRPVASRYSLVPLPLEEASAINDRGQVAGASGGHAALWQNGRMWDLGTLPPPNPQSDTDPPQSKALALNNRGQVAGNSGLFISYPGDIGGGFDSRPFLWTAGRLQPLGTLGGEYGEANGISDTGVVVGQADRKAVRDPSDGTYRSRTVAFLCTNGNMRDLGTLGGDDSVAQGVNARGQVVGWSGFRPRPKDPPEPFIIRAFLWEKGSMRDLGSLPGFESSSATAINNAGQVVGELYRTYTEYRTTSRAFLWEQGQMHNLGAPAGCSSTALAINDRGQVVGFAQPRGVDQRALLWSGGRMEELNDLIPPGTSWTLLEARGINRCGEIVGIGTFNGARRGFLLVPRAASTAGSPSMER